MPRRPKMVHQELSMPNGSRSKGTFKPPWTQVVGGDENGKLIYIPNELFHTKRKHRKRDKWVRLWFFKDRRKTQIPKKQVSSDLEITSKLEYQIGTFYKISQLSSDDYYFDYYYKLKEGLPPDIFKKNNRFKTPLSDATRKNRVPRGCKYIGKPLEKTYEIDENGKYVVRFE